MDDAIFLEPYKCYCSCEECKEWEAKTGEKPDCELMPDAQSVTAVAHRCTEEVL